MMPLAKDLICFMKKPELVWIPLTKTEKIFNNI